MIQRIPPAPEIRTTERSKRNVVHERMAWPLLCSLVVGGRPPPVPPNHPLLQLPKYHCDKHHRADPLSPWHDHCALLTRSWQLGATMVHFGHSNDPETSEPQHVRMANWNAGDAVLPVAARRPPVAVPPAGLSVRAEQPAQSPPSHGSPESSSGLDSKDFFRKVRLRLTYEQFNSFLANITRLNEHNQSVEETLRCAQSLFGADGHDLFLSFKVLIDSLVDK